MAGYNEIRGLRVKYLSADPSNAENGQVWYNSTTGNLRAYGMGVAAWSSGASIANARFNMGTGNTPNTAAIIFGGSGTSALTEEFDGSGWTAGGNLNQARTQLPGFGTQTTAVGAGGYNPPPGNLALVEEYNGSSWSEVNNIPTAQRGSAAFGTLTAGVIAGGVGSTTNLTTSYEYDGTNWTSTSILPTGTDRTEGAGTGTSSAGLIASGDTRVSFEYNGTSWIDGGSTNSDHDGGSDTGIQTQAVVFGGFLSPGSGQVTSTETYDGTSFSTSPASMASGRYGIGKGGSSGTAAVAGGGDNNPGTINSTEEFNLSSSVITVAAWASNPALSYSVNSDTAASGSLTSAVSAGGYNAPAGPGTVSYIANAASWNGTAWTNITDMPERRTNANAVGATAPAFYVYGGANQPPSPGTAASYLTTTHTWNGSAWGSGAALAEGQSDGGGAGTPSAIVLLGGVAPPGTISNNIAEYNGSSWSNNPVNMPTNMSSCAATGTATAAIVMGGYQGASPFPSAGVTNTYSWNGTGVSAGGALLFGLLGTAGSGPAPSAFLYGGRNTGGNKEARCMTYNGTAWSTAPSLGTGRDYIGRGPTGSPTAALAIAGSCPTQSLVEEFSSETSAAGPAQTITVS